MVAFVACSVACSQSAAPAADAGPADAGGGDAGNGDAGDGDAGTTPDGGSDGGDAGSVTASTASLSGLVIYDSFNGTPNVPADVTPIGIVDGGSSLTDGDGGYALLVPANQQLLLLANLEGEVPVQRVVVVPPQGLRVDLHNLDIDAWVGLEDELGSAVINNFSHGEVVIRFPGSGDAGAGAALVGAGPDAGRVVRGDSVYFYNLAPGPLGINLGAPDSGCIDTFAPQVTSYPVSAGVTTEIVLSCP